MFPSLCLSIISAKDPACKLQFHLPMQLSQCLRNELLTGMRTRIVLHTRLTLLMIMSMTASCTVIFSQSAADTVIRIPDVEIKASRYQQFGNDIKTDEYHQDELSPFSGESLGRFLISKTALNVRS